MHGYAVACARAGAHLRARGWQVLGQGGALHGVGPRPSGGGPSGRGHQLFHPRRQCCSGRAVWPALLANAQALGISGAPHACPRLCSLAPCDDHRIAEQCIAQSSSPAEPHVVPARHPRPHVAPALQLYQCGMCGSSTHVVEAGGLAVRTRSPSASASCSTGEFQKHIHAHAHYYDQTSSDLQTSPHTPARLLQLSVPVFLPCPLPHSPALMCPSLSRHSIPDSIHQPHKPCCPSKQTRRVWKEARPRSWGGNTTNQQQTLRHGYCVQPRSRPLQ